jgi:DNA-binding transcriptional MocR family regulator
MSELVHEHITGDTAVKIAHDLENAVRSGKLQPGHRLPAVRQLAGDLGVSPATVASAYRSLQARAVVVAHRRLGTRVSHRPLASSGAAPSRPRQIVAKGAIDLSDGNPDPALLPAVDRILRKLKYRPRLYGEEPMHAGLIKIMRREMETDGVRVGHCAIVSGAMDGIDCLLAEHLKPGDRVAVEDPGFTGHHDLVASRGLTLVPVRIDEQGMLPDALHSACVQGVRAVVMTPRAQSPTGAAMTDERANELRRVLHGRAPEALIIEDDHASFLCESTPSACVSASGATVKRWAHIRSLSKSFNPDLRLAVMTGDDQTMMRVLDRIVVTERWVSHMLQATAHALLGDATVRAQVRKAGREYDQRRARLTSLLASAGLQATGRSGYNLWLPVVEETATVQALAARGWLVAAGERFRLASPPGIRITASCLTQGNATRFVAALVETLGSHPRRSVA